jgi:hypothetical protein
MRQVTARRSSGYESSSVFPSFRVLSLPQYYNTADEYLGDLPPDTTYGGGPFRELRVLVDGQVAGVAFPYAVIFTGGINPSVWR